MSRRAARIEQAETGIAEVQKVLDQAHGALEVAGRIDEAATNTVRRSRTFLKLVLVLGIIGVVVIVARKVMANNDTGPDPDDYSGGDLA